MTTIKLKAALMLALALSTGAAQAAVSAEEAGQLKTTLTPLGGERAGNKDGTIPAWTGAATPNAGIVDGRRQDPFANEKPLYSINVKNMDQYASKLTEGTKELMKKFPDTFRIDVYPTHRTAIAPQWVYDNTAKNAVNAKLVEGGAGPQPTGAYGGIPFPIPKSGIEAMWNHQLYWRGESYHLDVNGYQLTQDGQWINVMLGAGDFQLPYYAKDAESQFGEEYWWVRQTTMGPAIRAGEAITGRLNMDESKSQSWTYLTGQRRVRKLPNPCCDTPTPISAGVSTFDEVSVFTGRMDRFDWKLVGKQEMYIPYNDNKFFQPAKDSEVLGTHHLNPDYVRWELHRVWVVEATLKPGQRHTSVKTRYYLDEDTWAAVSSDRYDASGQLARMGFAFPAIMSDFPAVATATWGIHDFVAGNMFVMSLPNERRSPWVPQTPKSSANFTADAMAGSGVR